MTKKMLELYKSELLNKNITKEEYLDLVKSLNLETDIDNNLDDMKENDICRKIIEAALQGIVKLI